MKKINVLLTAVLFVFLASFTCLFSCQRDVDSLTIVSKIVTQSKEFHVYEINKDLTIKDMEKLLRKQNDSVYLNVGEMTDLISDFATVNCRTFPKDYTTLMIVNFDNNYILNEVSWKGNDLIINVNRLDKKIVWKTDQNIQIIVPAI